MKILISVLSYLDNGIYSKFYEMQNKTWDSIPFDGVETFYYVGNGKKKEISGKLIINNLPETVQNEAYKFINFLEHTINMDYDYVFHTNSSSYVDKKLLYNWLLDKPRDKFYSGVKGEYNGHYFASGCGFTISKDVVKIMLDNQSKWEHGCCDDATLGILLKNSNINVYEAPRFDIVNYDGTIPTNYFHYRCKTSNRELDIINLQRIHAIKQLV
jgi:hypothetical protein